MFRVRLGNFQVLNNMSWLGNCEGLGVQFLRTSLKVEPSAHRLRNSRYLQVAMGSCTECKLWLEMSRDEGFLAAPVCDRLSNGFNVVGAMLTSLWKQWQDFRR